jgi:hypothetical protein
MERKTKTFIWGALAGAAIIIVAIVGLLAWGYFKGTTIQAEKSARQEKAVAEQVQRFGAVCSDALPEAMAYFYKTLVPTLSALQQGSSDWKQLPALTQGVKNQEKFLSHCSGQVHSLGDDSSFKLSRQLMSAANKLAIIHALLNGIEFGIRIDNCDQACQLTFVRSATEESGKLEKVLLGENAS